MRYIIILSIFIGVSYANTITLETILKSTKKHNQHAKALEQHSLALEAKNQANTALDPIEVFATGTRANPTDASSEYEYGAGLSKKILLNNIQAKEQLITRLNNQATLLEKEVEIVSFHHTIKNLYHQHCIDHNEYQSLVKNYNDFQKLYNKKEKAYNYQEISKTELMQLAIEKNSLSTQLQQSKMQKEQSKKSLLSLAYIPYKSTNRLSCQDRYPITQNITLPKDSYNLSTQAYKKRLQSSKTTLQRYSSTIDSLDVTMQYDKEIDMQKYTVGLSVPLNFTSKRSQQERVTAMYQERTTTLEYHESMHQKRIYAKQIIERLKSKAIMIESIKKNLKSYKNELLPLIKKSYDLGESSVIEYLLNRQKYYQLKQELYKTQREYYQRLFGLYSLIQTKE